MNLSGDGPIRGPMSWSAGKPNAGFSTAKTPYRASAPNAATHNADAQRATPGSLFHHYKGLIALRKAQAALRSGSYEAVEVQGPVLSFVRRTGNEAVLVALNYSAQNQPLQRTEALTELLFAQPQAASGRLAPWGVKVWSLKP